MKIVSSCLTWLSLSTCRPAMVKAAGVRRDSPRAVTILMKMDRPKKTFPFCTRVRKPKLALPRPTRMAPMMMARLEPRTWMYCADCPVSITVFICMVMICLAKYRCEDERGDEDGAEDDPGLGDRHSLAQSLGGVEGSDEGEGDSSDEHSPADEEQVGHCLASHWEVLILFTKVKNI